MRGQVDARSVDAATHAQLLPRRRRQPPRLRRARRARPAEPDVVGQPHPGVRARARAARAGPRGERVHRGARQRRDRTTSASGSARRPRPSPLPRRSSPTPRPTASSQAYRAGDRRRPVAAGAAAADGVPDRRRQTAGRVLRRVPAAVARLDRADRQRSNSVIDATANAQRRRGAARHVWIYGGARGLRDAAHARAHLVRRRGPWSARCAGSPPPHARCRRRQLPQLVESLRTGGDVERRSQPTPHRGARRRTRSASSRRRSTTSRP